MRAIPLVRSLWPAPRIADALNRLAQPEHGSAVSAGAGAVSSADRTAPPPGAPPEALDRWLSRAARALDADTVPVEVAYGEIDGFLETAGPALIQLPPRRPAPAGAGGGAAHHGDSHSDSDGGAGAQEADAEGEAGPVLAVLQGGRRWLRCLAPDGSRVRVAAAEVRAALVGRLEAGEARLYRAILDQAGLTGRRRDDAEEALLEESLSHRRLRVGWLIRPAAEAGLNRQMSEAGVWSAVAVALGAQVLGQALLVGSWFTLGELTLLGHFEWAWLDAWALLLLSAVPVLLLAVRAEGLITLRLGTVFKRRLLDGILKLQPEEVRTRGSGQFMGMAMEADVLELVSLAGGVTALLAVLRVAAALVVLALAGGAGLPAAVLLVCWTALAVGLGHRVWRRAEAWAAEYRLLTNDLVERMTGHRTRLVQEDPARRHTDEDARLAAYWQDGLGLDRLASLLEGGLARGWMLAGLLGLAACAVLAPPGPHGEGGLIPLALCLLGVLLAYQAFLLMAQAVPSLIQLAVAWREVKPLLEAAGRPRPAEPLRTDPQPPPEKDASSGGWPLLAARGLGFAYPGRRQPVLERVDLDVVRDARLLLEGPSGGGKSTLAGLLSGLREADTGVLLLNGVERAAIGPADWRRRVLTVPQFHENHVFSATFAFNLLMGRGWPPTPEDLARAGAACRAVGLGPLLEQMPAGFQQMVGESGWQLSHGERSRLFVARALLQRPDLLILDESFAALDPENLNRALKTVLRRAPALIVIAHP